MFRKVFRPVLNFLFQPHDAKLRAGQSKFQGAMDKYKAGQLEEAKTEFEKLVKENPSDKASRGWVGRISVEIKEEGEPKKGNNPGG